MAATERVAVRVSRAEKAALRARAVAAGLSMAAYIRRCVARIFAGGAARMRLSIFGTVVAGVAAILFMFGPVSVARAAGPIAGTLAAAPAYEFVRSLTCTNTNDVSAKLAGPGGISATLKIFTGDDGAKEYHNCGIGVWIDMPNRKESGAGNVYNSDGDYGRAFSIRVAGFSPDGRGIVGVIADWGESTDLFRYDVAADHTDDADLTSYLTRLRAGKCGNAIDIVGMTRSGLIVVQPAAGSVCGGRYRAAIDARSGRSMAWTQVLGLVPVFAAGAK